MEFRIDDAAIIRIPKELPPLVLQNYRSLLTYTDQSKVFPFKKFKEFGGHYCKTEEEYKAKLAEKAAELKQCILFEDSEGYWTYSGLQKKLLNPLTNSITIQNNVVYPPAKGLDWKPENPPWPFQVEACEALIKARHAGVSIGTGLGKSMIIAMLIRHYGLKTVVMTPSVSISEQLYDDFVELFGTSKVGRYYDGYKDTKQLIIVANGQSLTRISPESAAGRALAASQCFIADESHQTPAVTFEKVCLGIFKKAPYRFFFSATQVRGDGKGIVLEGITGPIVYNKTVKEGIDEKYLAEPRVQMLQMPPNGERYFWDQNKMTRHHLFYNPFVTAKIGSLCNSAASAGMPVLVLVEELEQFTKLFPYLQHEVGFAHGGVTKENKGDIPEQFHESDKKGLVKAFNAGRLPILVGTSCISTGTNIKAVKFLVYWQGGQSEVQIKQAIGRATRKVPGKTFCHIVDFDVRDDKFLDENGDPKASTCHRHAQKRLRYYRSLTDRVIELP